MQPGYAAMTNFTPQQRIRNYADDLATGRERRIGQCAHQSDTAAAVYQANIALGQQLTKLFSGATVRWVRAAGGATKDADTPDRSHLLGGILYRVSKKARPNWGLVIRVSGNNYAPDFTTNSAGSSISFVGNCWACMRRSSNRKVLR